MLAVLFATSYQSIHVFSHQHQQKHLSCNDSFSIKIEHQENNFTETNNCPVCDFKFAAFVSPQGYYFQIRISQNEIPYLTTKKELVISLPINALFLRGPPALV